MNSELRRELSKTLPICFLLTLILTLPVILSLVGLPSRERLYSGLPAFRGVTSGIEHEIFSSNVDADIVLVGSSTTYATLRPQLVNYYFSHKAAKKLKIISLAILGAGPDVDYLVLRDYLNKHKPKLVVVALPWRSALRNGPDEGLGDFWRFGEYPELFKGISLKDQIAIYSEMALKSPRQALNLVRPNPIENGQNSETLIAAFLSKSYGQVEPNKVVFHSVAASLGEVHDRDDPIITYKPDRREPYNYFAVWYKKIEGLISTSGAKLLYVNYPEPDDDPTKITVNLPIANFANGQTILGFTTASLLGVTSREKVKSYFSDNRHIKAIGAELFCARSLPSIEAYYTKVMGDTR